MMSLKTTFITLFVVGLAHQLGAFTLNSHPHNINKAPGVNFTLPRFGGLSANISNGAFHGLDTIHNSSAWRQSSGANFKVISQNITLPKLSVLYGEVNASLGNINATGQLVVRLGDAPLNLTVNATSLGSRCHLQINVHPDNMTAENITVKTTGLGVVGEIFQGIDSVWNNFTTTLAHKYNETLPLILSTSIQHNLAQKTNLNAICKQLLASSPTNFPEPKF